MNNNHFFALFNLPVRFEIDKSELKKQLLELQKQHHPDRLCDTASAQNAALINHAFNTLNQDDLRAAYLLEMTGKADDLDKSIDDLAFLGEMMQLRIELEETQNRDELNQIHQQIISDCEQQNAIFVNAFENQQWAKAQDAVRKLKFLHKLSVDVHEKLGSSVAIDNNDDDLYV